MTESEALRAVVFFISLFYFSSTHACLALIGYLMP